jgi:hypothetical protein
VCVYIDSLKAADHALETPGSQRASRACRKQARPTSLYAGGDRKSGIVENRRLAMHPPRGHDAGHDLGPDFWLMAYHLRRFDMGAL